MPTILSDHNIQGHLDVLLSIWTSPEWKELWELLDCKVQTFRSRRLPRNTPDSDLWRLCQSEQMILLTANRNARGENSLEAVSRNLNQPDSIPVLTIADADRLIADRKYAESVASRIMDFLANVENLRGTRRLFVP